MLATQQGVPKQCTESALRALLRFLFQDADVGRGFDKWRHQAQRCHPSVLGRLSRALQVQQQARCDRWRDGVRKRFDENYVPPTITTSHQLEFVHERQEAVNEIYSGHVDKRAYFGISLTACLSKPTQLSTTLDNLRR